MAKQKNGNGKSGKDLEIVGPAPLPAHLRDHASDGLQSQGESQMQSRLKIVQSSATKELREAFADGTVIATPDMTVVAEPGKSFLATPVYRWTTWAEVRDRKDGTEPFIMAESNDVNGELAQLAKNPATRTRTYDDGKYTSKIAEHLNWVFLLHTGGMPGELCTFTYCRGGWTTGSRLLRTLQRLGAPIWSYVLELKAVEKSNKAGDTYFILDFVLPKEHLCTEQQKGALQGHYKLVQAAFDAGSLGTPVDREGDGAKEAEAASA